MKSNRCAFSCLCRFSRDLFLVAWAHRHSFSLYARVLQQQRRRKAKEITKTENFSCCLRKERGGGDFLFTFADIFMRFKLELCCVNGFRHLGERKKCLRGFSGSSSLEGLRKKLRFCFVYAKVELIYERFSSLSTEKGGVFWESIASPTLQSMRISRWIHWRKFSIRKMFYDGIIGCAIAKSFIVLLIQIKCSNCVFSLQWCHKI